MPFDAKIAERLEAWNKLKTEGGSDPFHADGVNMNLVRNHIIYYLQSKEEQKRQGTQMSLFMPDGPGYDESVIPPLVENDYMARPDEIRAGAKQTLQQLEASDDVAALIEHGEAHVSQLISFIRSIIENDDLVAMRRYEKPERVFDSLEWKINAMKAKLAERN